MKMLLVRLLAFWLAVTPVYADSSFVAPTAIGQAATPLSIALGGTADTGTAWTSYSGSVGAITCGGGTITASIGAARYKSIGKSFWAHIDITETSNSACASNILIATALPAIPNNTVTCSGINKNTGVGLVAFAPNAGANSLTVATAAGAVPITANSQFLSIDCSFESQ